MGRLLELSILCFGLQNLFLVSIQIAQSVLDKNTNALHF